MFRDCKIDSLIDAMSCSVEVEMNERDLEAGKKKFVIEIGVTCKIRSKAGGRWRGYSVSVVCAHAITERGRHQQVFM